MIQLIKQVYRSGVSYLSLWIKIQMLQAKIRARNLAKGILLIWLSGIFWFIGIGMLLTALFFNFSELPKLSMGGLLTASISLAIALIISAIGLLFIKARV